MKQTVMAELMQWMAQWPLPDHVPSPRELAEVLWLAKQRIPPMCPAEARRTHSIPELPKDPSPHRDLSDHETDTGKEANQPDRPTEQLQPAPGAPAPFFPAVPKALEQEPMAHLLPLKALPTGRDLHAALASLPVSLNAPRLLSSDLTLLRALRPLMQRSVSKSRRGLDEEATAEQSAEQRLPLPVFQPLLEPRFVVTLLVDSGLSMEVWRPMADEFMQILVRSRGFRDVQVVNIVQPIPGETAVGFSLPGTKVIRWRKPDDLRKAVPFSMEADGSSLLLLLSDTAGPHWWSGAMFEALRAWSRQLPVAILHMLPLWMAQRTALRALKRASIRNGEPAGESARYRAIGIDDWDDNPSTGGAIPVIRMEPGELANWAAMAMGKGREVSAGVILPQAGDLRHRLAAMRPRRARATSEEERTGEQLWDKFRRSASPEAQRLMGVMAAAPVLTLPVLRLLKETTLSRCESPVPLVEVLLGGLLGPVPRPGQGVDTTVDEVQYAIRTEVLELLRRDLSAADTVNVVRKVSELLERRWNNLGTGHSFRAVLSDPEVKLPSDLEGVVNFATATAELIERIPGEVYQRFAAQLRRRCGKPAVTRWPVDMRFEEVSFQPAQLLRIPEPELRRFQWAQFEDVDLLPIRFDTATIENTVGKSKSGGGAPTPAALSQEVEASPSEVPSPEHSESATDADVVESVVMGAGPVLEVSSWKVTDRKDSTWGFQEPLSPGPSTTSADPPALTMLRIPAGSFLMGSSPDEPDRYDNEGPQHQVQLQEFLLARTPITQAQWREVAGWQPLEGEPAWKGELKEDPLGSEADSRFRGENRPVVNVSWHDAMEFCRRLRCRTGKSYTLPSEAQWEYACRAGSPTPSPFHFGATISPQLANYDATISYAGGPTGEYREQTTDVASFPANGWGLHDMHGNVWEWCLDHWHGSYVGGDEKAPTDGSAWIRQSAEAVERRLLRGGSWGIGPRFCRSACRYGIDPDVALLIVGFRICCLPQDLLLDP